MAGSVTLTGTVVEGDPTAPFPPPAGGGLYLRTAEGKYLRLLAQHMATQMADDVLHAQSRAAFASHLGRTVTVSGYLSRNTLWSAMVKE